MKTIITYHNSPSIDCGQYDIMPDGIYIDGALIDLEFMRSAGFYLTCDNAQQAAIVRGLIEGA
jgi:hypothetical protein